MTAQKHQNILARLLLISKTLRQVFGLWLSPIPKGCMILIFQSIARVSMWLDRIFFPSYKKATIDRPIFIIGNPRSGTTVLQRFLYESEEVCSFRVWQMIVPSIFGQKILKPFISWFTRFNPAKHYSNEAHETSLDSVETDEVLFSFRFLDGLFVILFFLAWSKDNYIQDLVESRRKGSIKNKIELEFYRQCLLRNISMNPGKRVLGKPFTFSLRVEDVLEKFPDAKLIYMVRDPLSVIPSGINMLKNVTDGQFGSANLPQHVQERYFNHLYEGEKALYQQFYRSYRNGKIGKENLLVVKFPELMNNFEEVMSNVFDFVGMEISDTYREKIRLQGEKQRSHKSKHTYNLDDFGLSEEQIRKDLAFVYKEFGL